MTAETSNDLLHGMTLKAILEDLVARHDWPGLAERINLRCFASDPSISSSLRFLRKTEWARRKVEQLYLADHRRIERNAKRNRRRAAMRAQRSEEGVVGKRPPAGGVGADETGPQDRG